MYSEKPNINGGTTSFVTVGNNDVNKRARVSQKVGGCTEVTFRTVDKEESLGKMPSTFYNKGSYEYRNGEVRLNGKQSFTPSKDIESVHEGIMSTAKDSFGVPVNDISKVNDNTRITIDGISTTVGMAAKLGLLKKNSNLDNQGGNEQNGSYIDNVSKPVSVPDNNVDFNGKAKILLDNISGEHGSDFTENIVMKAVTGIENQDLTSSAGELASKLGVEPKYAEEMIYDVVTEIETNVAKHINQSFQNVDGSEVINWCSENLDKTTKLDLQRRIYFGDVTAVHELVEHYKTKH